MSNLLIVEAENDATFLKAVVKYVNESNDDLFIDVNTEKGYITLEFKNENKTYRGLSKAALIARLEDVKRRLLRDPISKIGIVLDQDNTSKEDRLKLVNDCLKAVFPEAEEIADTHQFKTLTTIEEDNISIACYFINVNGQGELETLLRIIKNHDSSIADCLESCLRQCLEKDPKEITPKNLDKTWIDNYLRYDTCQSKKEKGDRNKKCSFNAEGFKYVMENKTDIWNFEASALEQLKAFLELFSTSSVRNE